MIMPNGKSSYGGERSWVRGRRSVGRSCSSYSLVTAVKSLLEDGIGRIPNGNEGLSHVVVRG